MTSTPGCVFRAKLLCVRSLPQVFVVVGFGADLKQQQKPIAKAQLVVVLVIESGKQHRYRPPCCLRCGMAQGSYLSTFECFRSVANSALEIVSSLNGMHALVKLERKLSEPKKV